MKSIDFKSLLTGTLLASTIFLGVAATSKDDAGKWDEDQVWETATVQMQENLLTSKPEFLFLEDTAGVLDTAKTLTSWPEGWEPVTRPSGTKNNIWFVRRRVK